MTLEQELVAQGLSADEHAGQPRSYAEWLVWRDETLAQLKGWVVAAFDDRVH